MNGKGTMKNKKQKSENEKYPYCFPCPVCGSTVETWEICEACGWHNDGPGEPIDEGPNEITYAEAVEYWNKYHTYKN